MLATLQNAPYKDTGHGVPDELRPGDDGVTILVTHSQDLPATRRHILTIGHLFHLFGMT